MQASRSPSAQPSNPAPNVARWAPLVVWGTVAAGGAIIAVSLVQTAQQDAWGSLVPFLALAVLAELLSVNAYTSRSERVTLTFSIAAYTGAVVALPLGAPLVALANVAQVFVHRDSTREKHLFNVATMALATAASAVAFSSVHPPRTELGLWTLMGTIAAVAAFHLVNIGLVSLVVSVHSGASFLDVLRGSAWYAPNKLAIGLIGGCIALVHAELGPLGALIFGLPLGVLRYTLTMYTRQTRRTIDALEHQARRDLLTGLPNRLLLHERMRAALADAQEHGALLLLDLDRFKEVNDTFGHHVGDQLLEEIGHRLSDRLAADVVVARLGGDEFAVLLPGSAREHAEATARELLSLLDQPVVVEGQQLRVGGSIGVVEFPTDGGDPDTLLRRADVAMYVAKRTRSGFAHYDPTLDEHTPERLALVGELREAIEQEALTLVYQPQIALDSGQVTGVEALVRWPHPRRGVIPPAEFMDMAEHTGLIEPLTRCVLRIALRQCRAWLDAGQPLRVAVNVSAHDLHDGFSELLTELLSTYRVPAQSLQLELTEDAMMADPQQSETVLRQLHAIGVSISIDDFGTGYSSLAYLGRLPIDELKIDRSFVLGMQHSSRQAAIVRSTINLGHDLGLVVVAEGVEDQAAQDQLAKYGCDVMQGYFASKPVSASALERWLADRAVASTKALTRAA